MSDDKCGWQQARGIWKDAFPENISSTEIIQCHRNGWDYDDFIRLRDMGIDPDDIAGIAQKFADLQAQVTRLQGLVRIADTYIRSRPPAPHWYEHYVLTVYPEAKERGDLDPIDGSDA